MSNDGLILIDKPAGLSSAQVISCVKRKLNISEKIGHAGTLDPFATGLLVVLIGRATRLADYFQAGEKSYSGEIGFGTVTDSDDITGAVIEKRNRRPDPDSIRKVAEAMLGTFEQLPPKICALNVRGKRAYQLIRQGLEFELAPRRVTLSAIQLHAYTDSSVKFSIDCSKGFYVRAFARDIGERLGCGACLNTLRREKSRPFSVEQAVKADEVTLSALIAWDQAWRLIGRQEILIEDREFDALKNGLIPYSLSARALQELDSCADELIVYRRQRDGFAGGLLSKVGSELKIAVNM